jgi:hypothetical protein
MNIFKNVQTSVLKNTFKHFSQLYPMRFIQYPIKVDEIIPNIETVQIIDENEKIKEIEFKGRNSKYPKRVYKKYLLRLIMEQDPVHQ